MSCFTIQPGNQNALETGYCPKFLCHLLVEVIGDIFLFDRLSSLEGARETKPHFISRVNNVFAGFNVCWALRIDVFWK